MKLYNSKTKELVSFVQAVKDGLGKERGLYCPSYIPILRNIDELLEFLSKAFTEAEEEESKSFHQRYRDYLDKIQSGDLIQVAKVYRLLCRRSMLKPLGTKDKSLYETARQLLTSEIVFAKNITDEQATKMLDEAMEDMVF